jgi:hypothetical protein
VFQSPGTPEARLKLSQETGVEVARAWVLRALGAASGRQAETLRLYALIATMDAAAPLPSLADQSPTWASASRGAGGWKLKQLADRLAEMPCLVAKDVAEGWILVIPQSAGYGRSAQTAVVR